MPMRLSYWQELVGEFADALASTVPAGRPRCSQEGPSAVCRAGPATWENRRGTHGKTPKKFNNRPSKPLEADSWGMVLGRPWGGSGLVLGWFWTIITGYKGYKGYKGL